MSLCPSSLYATAPCVLSRSPWSRNRGVFHLAAARILPGAGRDKTGELKERRGRWVLPLSVSPGEGKRNQNKSHTRVLFFVF